MSSVTRSWLLMGRVLLAFVLLVIGTFANSVSAAAYSSSVQLGGEPCRAIVLGPTYDAAPHVSDDLLRGQSGVSGSGFGSTVRGETWTEASSLRGTLATDATVGDAAAANPLDGTTYSQKVLDQASQGPGEYHSFPESVDGFANQSHVTTELGGDGSAYTHVRIPGGYGGSNGVFHYIFGDDNVIWHRLFEPN